MFAVTTAVVVSRSSLGDIRNRAATQSGDTGLYGDCLTECQEISGKKCHWTGASWELGMYCTESSAGTTPTITYLAPGSSCNQVPFEGYNSCLRCPNGSEPNGSGGYRCKNASCAVSYGDTCNPSGDAQGSANSCVSCCPEGYKDAGAESYCYRQGERPESGLNEGDPCFPGGDGVGDPQYCGNCPYGYETIRGGEGARCKYRVAVSSLGPGDNCFTGGDSTGPESCSNCPNGYESVENVYGGRCREEATTRKPSACPSSGYCTSSGSCSTGYRYIQSAPGCSSDGSDGCCPSGTGTQTPTQAVRKPSACPSSGYCTSSGSCSTGYRYIQSASGCSSDGSDGCCPDTVAPSGPPTGTGLLTPTPHEGSPTPTIAPQNSCYDTCALLPSFLRPACELGCGIIAPTATPTVTQPGGPTPTQPMTPQQQCMQQCGSLRIFVSRAVCQLSCITGGVTPTPPVLSPTPTEEQDATVTCRTWIGGYTVSHGHCEYRPPESGQLQMCREDIGGWGPVTGTCTNDYSTPTPPNASPTQSPELTCTGGEPVGACQIRRVMQKCTVLDGWTFALWSDPDKSGGCPNGTTCIDGSKVYQPGDCHFMNGSTKICRGTTRQFVSGTWAAPKEGECHEDNGFGEYVQGISTVSMNEILRSVFENAILRSFPVLMFFEGIFY